MSCEHCSPNFVTVSGEKIFPDGYSCKHCHKDAPEGSVCEDCPPQEYDKEITPEVLVRRAWNPKFKPPQGCGKAIFPSLSKNNDKCGRLGLLCKKCQNHILLDTDNAEEIEKLKTLKDLEYINTDEILKEMRKYKSKCYGDKPYSIKMNSLDLEYIKANMGFHAIMELMEPNKIFGLIIVTDEKINVGDFIIKGIEELSE